MTTRCPEATWLSNEEYLTRFNRIVVESRIPLSGGIDLTHRCNLRCIHCYHGERPGHLLEKEMTTKEVLTIIDEITEAGCLYFLITGGEPLLRKDFPEVYRHAKENGMVITLFTNGTLINDSIIDLLTELPPYEVEISLYGATSSTYEKITGIPGSYEKCLHGIQRLLDNRIHLRLKTILMTVNSHEFYDIKKMADDFRAKFRFDAAIFPRFNGDRSPLKLRVPPEEAIEKEFSDEMNIHHWERFHKKMRGNRLSDSMYHCGAGRASFHLDPYGNLSPCLMTTDISYNIKNANFMTGWKDGMSIIYDKKAQGDLQGCNQCEKIHMCDFCPAFFASENGEEGIRSEYICALGNERFKKIHKYLKIEYQDAIL